MNKANGAVERIKIGFVIGLLASLTGCAGLWGGGYYDYYGDTVIVSEPDMYLFGGDYYRGRDAHNYSHRGSESRGAAHTSRVQSGVAVHSNSVQSGVAARPSGVQSHGAVHSGANEGGKR